MATVRTFIAIELAEGVAGALADLRDELSTHGEANWVANDSIHLTLLFLGEVPKADILGICKTVQSVAKKHKKFNVDVRGLGAFPNNRRPKILWAGIAEGAEPLVDLHRDLEAALLELGCYRRENRAYRPHVTIGRLKPDEDTDKWSEILAQQAEWSGGTSEIRSVIVYSSDLRGDRPVYAVLGTGRLS
jgi:RNA 2',3'-cyclic 3'-phosphodiesterase